MKYSQFYAPTKKDVAKTDSINAYLLTKAGYVSQVAAGVYALLPLGLRSIKKIEQIVREEMDAIGGNEVSFTALQSEKLWQDSGRWDDENFRSILYKDQESGMTLAPTHEEPMVVAVKEAIQSYRDLPVLLYQFQTKFRKELRPKSGLLRGREFRMKDLYSFHLNDEDHQKFYEIIAGAYTKSYDRIGLESYRVKASGGFFTKQFSDEFQVICETGEDEILVNHDKKTGYNKEVEDQIPASEKDKLERVKGIEVGNIFHLETKYSKPLGLEVLDEKGERQTVIMGSYGIGISRLLGTLAEVFNDENGLKMPKQVAPFHIYIIDMTDTGKGEELAELLEKEGYEVLLDDRETSNGGKMVDADLLGMPIRLVYSKKTAEADSIEVKVRETGEVSLVKEKDLLNHLKKLLS